MNTALPQALLRRNPLGWLGVFGPGAVIASLTIGAGELIFSSRGGALFGYHLLWYFACILFLKWILVYGVARQMVLTGRHPFQRWMDIPGPRGWLTLVFLILAAPAFPIWVAFHAGATGSLLAGLTGTARIFHGTGHYIWGMGLLGLVLVLISQGGYARLERLQLWIVLIMLATVVLSLVLLKPDWAAILEGILLPQRLAYPGWAQDLSEFQGRPVWVEVVTYVGIIGGSGYDYLAYGAYLRDKGWGGVDGIDTLESLSQKDPRRPLLRTWLRAPLVDCTLSFLAVLVFSGVFVACGALLLGPKHQIPAGSNLLALQADFVGDRFSWLKPLYFVGAFLTMFGTLYGTIEVAPAILREVALGFGWSTDRVRSTAVRWCGIGGFLVLVGSLWTTAQGQGGAAPGLVTILTPANLFTGVLACGIVCASSLWIELRLLPRDGRAHPVYLFLCAAAALVFLFLGVKAYWDHSRWIAFGILAATGGAGFMGAKLMQRRSGGR